jgi:hypothetical protein
MSSSDQAGKSFRNVEILCKNNLIYNPAIPAMGLIYIFPIRLYKMQEYSVTLQGAAGKIDVIGVSNIVVQRPFQSVRELLIREVTSGMGHEY